VNASTAPLLCHASFGVVDERVAHSQRGRPQKMGLIGKPSRGSEAQKRLVHQCRCLQCVIAAQPRAGPVGNVFQVLIENRKQNPGNVPDLWLDGAGIQTRQIRF